MYKLFVDDERDPVGEEWVVVRSSTEAKNTILSLGFPSFISFDHDLGDGENGYDLVKWICEYDMDHDVISSDFSFYVHSQNPVGKRNIEAYLDSYMKTTKEA